MILDVSTFAAGLTITNSIPLFATIFGIVALAGGAAGYFKASRGDSIIKYQATEIALRDAKVAGLEKDLAAITQSCNAKDETITELKKHNAYLQKLPQGGAQLKKLADIVERQDKNAAALYDQVKGLLNRESKK